MKIKPREMEPNRERIFDGEKRSGEQESDGGGEHR
jgi:hypothetical protein